jgi:excinuclease ABC subunit A
MNFLPDVYVPCEVCHGARYNRETLEVHYKGKTISEVLDMSIEEGVDFFAALPSIARHLKTLNEVGLGYVRLGQPAPTLSGGEAQRVKLASELQKRSTGRTLYVLDEPTTGLHFEDIRKLLGVLGRLVDNGNTVVVIEHNLDVIKTADWLIDMGPEGGSRGGAVIDEGTPETIAANPRSYTGEFLRPILEGREVPVGEAQPSLLDAGRGRPLTKAAVKRAAAEARQAASAAKKASAAAKKATPAKKAAPAAKRASKAPATKVATKAPVKKTVSKRAPATKTAGQSANGRTTRASARLAG